jgi:hypothetical protein
VRFGLTVPDLGEYADASLLADLAAEAEAAGWDAFFLWDHILYRRDPVVPAVDPWVAMTAIALRTSRVLRRRHRAAPGAVPPPPVHVVLVSQTRAWRESG